MMSSRTIPNSMGDKIKTNGLQIGSLKASEETNGSCGETYFYNDKFYHLCYSSDMNGWLVFIVEFAKEDLSRYVDDIALAQEAVTIH